MDNAISITGLSSLTSSAIRGAAIPAVSYPKLPVALKKVHPLATVPSYQTPGAAGFDVHAVIDPTGALENLLAMGGESRLVIGPGETAKIHTGIAVSIGNPLWALLLMPRSGLGSKGIVLANQIGLIDSDYQGELLVMLKNTSAEPFTVKHGDRIAQGVFSPVIQASFVEVEDFGYNTVRGTGGFGSTGV